MTRDITTSKRGKEMRIAIGALALAAITFAGGVAAAGNLGTLTAPAPRLGCTIRQSTSNGQILVQPTVTSDAGASGSYSLTLAGGGSGGSASIRQGGAFTAAADGTTTLGAVSVGASGADYRARLEVTAGSRSAVCTTTIGNAL